MKKAFTLIELLVVVSIIGVLAVALVPTIGSAPAKARDAARKTKIGEVIKAVEMYNIDEGKYPAEHAVNTAKCVLDGPDVHADFTAYLSSFELAGEPTGATCGDGIMYTPTADGYTVYVYVENESSGTHCGEEKGLPKAYVAGNTKKNIYAVER